MSFSGGVLSKQFILLPMRVRSTDTYYRFSAKSCNSFFWFCGQLCCSTLPYSTSHWYPNLCPSLWRNIGEIPSSRVHNTQNRGRTSSVQQPFLYSSDTIYCSPHTRPVYFVQISLTACAVDWFRDAKVRVEAFYSYWWTTQENPCRLWVSFNN